MSLVIRRGSPLTGTLVRTFHPLQLVMLALGLAIVRLSLPEPKRRS
jgi:hypothetical protein